MKRFVLILTLVLTTSLFAVGQRRSSTVKVFPNPLTVDIVTIGMKSATATKATSVELRNFIGRKLQSVQSNGRTEIEFTDMRQYPKGIYVVLVKDKRGKIVESQKFTISK